MQVFLAEWIRTSINEGFPVAMSGYVLQAERTHVYLTYWRLSAQWRVNLFPDQNAMSLKILVHNRHLLQVHPVISFRFPDLQLLSTMFQFNQSTQRLHTKFSTGRSRIPLQRLIEHPSQSSHRCFPLQTIL